MVRLTWEQVTAWRLDRQHLLARAPLQAMCEVVAGIGGLHAQLISSAELTLWARVEGLQAEDVQRALWEDRRLVKSWAMRGTLHLLPADEYPLWQAGLSTYRHYLKGAWLRYFGVTPDELEQYLAAIAQALDGRMLTREELAAEVAQRTGSAALGEKLRESWGALLKPASFRGHLCFAPSLGQHVRFTRPDRWLRGWSPVDPGAAMLEITRRFLAAYGPATPEDFGHWWGLDPAPALKQIRLLGDEVTQVEVEGTSGWMLTRDVPQITAAAAPASVRLLPAFDQYVIAVARQAEQVMPGPFRERIYRPQGWLSPVLLVNGRMEGVWRHEQKGRRLLVEIDPFVTLPGWARQAAEAEAERLAGFMAAELQLSWNR